MSFLLNFPLSEKRLHGHLEALCANLSFEHPTGRKAALGCLQQVASKFPQELLDEEADFLFLPLVTRLTGDEDSDCRQLASEVSRFVVEARAGKHHVSFLLLPSGDKRIAPRRLCSSKRQAC